MCRHSWVAWFLGCAVSFALLEIRAYRKSCHPTLSRELQRVTGCKRYPWTPLVFVGLGASLAAHLMTLRDLETDISSAGSTFPGLRCSQR